MDQLVFVSKNLNAVRVEADNYIDEAYSELLMYQSETGTLIVEAVANSSDKVDGLRSLVNEGVDERVKAVGRRIAQVFRSLIHRIKLVFANSSYASAVKKLKKVVGNIEEIDNSQYDGLSYNSRHLENLMKALASAASNASQDIDSRLETWRKIADSYHNIAPVTNEPAKTLAMKLCANLEQLSAELKKLIRVIDQTSTEAIKADESNIAKYRTLAKIMNQFVTDAIKSMFGGIRSLVNASKPALGSKYQAKGPAPSVADAAQQAAEAKHNAATNISDRHAKAQKEIERSLANINKNLESVSDDEPASTGSSKEDDSLAAKLKDIDTQLDDLLKGM